MGLDVPLLPLLPQYFRRQSLKWHPFGSLSLSPSFIISKLCFLPCASSIQDPGVRVGGLSVLSHPSSSPVPSVVVLMQEE